MQLSLQQSLEVKLDMDIHSIDTKTVQKLGKRPQASICSQFRVSSFALTFES